MLVFDPSTEWCKGPELNGCMFVSAAGEFAAVRIASCSSAVTIEPS